MHLQTSFPYIPKRYLVRKFLLHNYHYAPTHLALSAEEKAERKEYERKVTRYNPGKDRGKLAAWRDPVLEEERAWIIERDKGEIPDGASDKQDKGKGKAKVVGGGGGGDEEPELEDSEGIECQCCFSEYSFVCIFSAPIPRSSLDRTKWSNARKPIFFAQLVYLSMPPLSSVLTALPSSACILPSVNDLFLNLSYEEYWMVNLWIYTNE